MRPAARTYEMAGRILALAQEPDVDKSAAEMIARAVVTHDASYAAGMNEGLWYALGNRTDRAGIPPYRRTWIAINILLEEP